jgi:hypothetical protein
MLDLRDCNTYDGVSRTSEDLRDYNTYISCGFRDYNTHGKSRWFALVEI